MEQRKLGRVTDQRRALLRNQVSSLLWYGKIETTYPRAKEVSKIAEKLLTLAINTYEDITAKIETRKNEKNQDVKVEVTNDGPKRLAARRRIMAFVNDLQEIKPEKESKSKFYQRTGKIRHPLLERIFNELAPRYAQRVKEKGNAGGYTRVLKLGERKGDAAEAAIIELV